MGRSWVGTRDPGAPVRRGPLVRIRHSPPESSMILAGIDYIPDVSMRMSGERTWGYQVQMSALARRLDGLIDPDRPDDPALGLLDPGGRSASCLLVRPEVVAALLWGGPAHRPYRPAPTAGRAESMRHEWARHARRAQQAGGDAAAVARRAAVCWAVAIVAPDTAQAVIDELAAWDAMPEAVSPATVEAAILAGLSAAETRHTLEAPDGVDRIGALAALGGLHTQTTRLVVTQ